MAVNQIKAGAVLNYVILALNALAGLLYTPFLLRMLGQSEFGIYSLAASVIAYLSMLDAGFGNAVIRYTAKYRAEGKSSEQYKLFGLFTILYVIIGFLTLCLGLILYFNLGSMFGDTLNPVELERSKVIILLMVINLAFSFPLSIYGAIIFAYENFIFLRVMQIWRIVVNIVVMIFLLTLGYKAVAMVVLQTVLNFIVLGANVWYSRRKLNVRVHFGRFDVSLLKEIAIYSFWIFLNVIMDRIYWSTGQFILGMVSGTIAVAVFSVAIHLEGIYMSFSTAISSVFLPRVTKLVVKSDNKKEISDLFIRTGRIQYCILAFVLVGFIIFGRPFIDLWAGPGYSEAYEITLLFFISLTIPLMQNLGITILQARNQMKFRSLLYIVIAVVSLLFQYPLAKFYGGIGCAWAISVALLFGQGLIMNIYYNRHQGIDIFHFWREILKMTIVPAIAVIIGVVALRYVEVTSISRLFIVMVVFMILYLPAFWLFAMNKYERNLIKSPIMKIIRR